MRLTPDQIAMLAPKMLAHPRRAVLLDHDGQQVWSCPTCEEGRVSVVYYDPKIGPGLCPDCAEMYRHDACPFCDKPAPLLRDRCPRCQQALDWTRQEVPHV